MPSFTTHHRKDSPSLSLADSGLMTQEQTKGDASQAYSHVRIDEPHQTIDLNSLWMMKTLTEKMKCLPEESRDHDDVNSRTEICHDQHIVSSLFRHDNKYSFQVPLPKQDNLPSYSFDELHSSSMSDHIHHRNLGNDFAIEDIGDPGPQINQLMGFSHEPVGQAVGSDDSNKLEVLAKKFNHDVASIWSTDQTTVCDAWTSKVAASVSLLSLEDSGICSLSNIWSFSPGTSSHEVSSSSSSHLSSPLNHPASNNTSLNNHTEDSLFVQVSTSRASNATSLHNSCGSRASSSNDNHVICKKSEKKKTESKENLLTSIQTHFQPIRQDYYERGPNNVTDTQLSGLVPCSGKCPNHPRNRCDTKNKLQNKRLCDPRPASVSREELSLIVGPFKEDEDDIQEMEGESQAQKQVCDKHVVVKDVEEAETVTPAVDDYDAICSILNQVLNSQSPSCGNYEPLLVPTSPEPSSQIDAGISSFKSSVSGFDEFHPKSSLDPCPSNETYQSFVNIEHSNGFDDALQLDVYPNGEGYLPNWDANSSLYGCDASMKGHVEWSLGNDKRDASLSPQPPLAFFEFQPKIEHTVQYQKPCSFFLEGNCRKIDCKYSHDLRTITCKYWLEGFCFKGDQCPFRHEIREHSDPETSIQDKSLSFTIDSEQDFPTLGDRVIKGAVTQGPPETIVKPASPPGILFRSQVGRGRKKKRSGHQKAV